MQREETKRNPAVSMMETNASRNTTCGSSFWQRARIIQALRSGPKTTIELREQWAVMSPAPRVLELRLEGHIIVTVPVSAFTADGVRHYGVALYFLLTEPHSPEQLTLPLNEAANDALFDGGV